METFDITIKTSTGPARLDIRPLNKPHSQEYEVWNEDNLLFTLLFDKINGVFILANQEERAGTDPELIRKVSEILTSGETGQINLSF